MLVSVDYGPDGVTLLRRVEDYGDGTGQITLYNPDGTVASTEALTGLTLLPAFPPLDDTGALATLLAVIGTITVQEAANIEHVPVEHIEHEARSWAVASDG